MPNVAYTAAQTSQASESDMLPMLALIAVRDIRDEEALLNYRLSNHIARPAWYTPVDYTEDKRRWA